MTQPQPQQAQPGNMLTRRVGPLPMWVWILIVAIVAFGVIWFMNRNKSSSATDSSSGSGPTLYRYPGYDYGNVPVDSTGGSGSSTDPGAGTSPPPASSGGTPPPAQSSVTYPIVSGDTLYGIAAKFGLPESTLYQTNTSTIEAAARSHGLQNSNGGPNNTPGWWIFPGTVLTIPS